jgi:ankyrin repeat protein
MLPIEIQDKIFLYFDYENLERTRELQSQYVKDRTKYDNLPDVIRNSNCDKFINNVKWLLDQGIDPAADDNYAIKLASSNGHTEIVRLLLDDPRVDPAASANYAIKLASANGYTEVVKLLLDDPRVDPSANDNYAIHAASLMGHTYVVKLLSGDPRFDLTANTDYIRYVSAIGQT